MHQSSRWQITTLQKIKKKQQPLIILRSFASKLHSFIAISDEHYMMYTLQTITDDKWQLSQKKKEKRLLSRLSKFISILKYSVIFKKLIIFIFLFKWYFWWFYSHSVEIWQLNNIFLFKNNHKYFWFAHRRVSIQREVFQNIF